MMGKNNSILQILTNTLTILGGLIAAAFIILLLYVFDAMMLGVVRFVFGIGFCLSAIIVSRTKINMVLDVILMALYFAGLSLLTMLVYEQTQELYIRSIFMITVSLITYFTAKKKILPFVSVILFNLFLMLLVADFCENIDLVNDLFLGLWIVALLLVNNFEGNIIVKCKMPYSQYQVLQGGLFAVVGLSLTASTFILDGFGAFNIFNSYSLGVRLPQIIIPIIFAFMLYKIMQKLEVEHSRKIISVVTLSLVMCSLTWGAPYLAASVLLALIAWHYGYKIQAAVAVAILIAHLVKSYYSMELSLLSKSIMLFFSGMVLLVGWGIYMKNQKKKYHEQN